MTAFLVMGEVALGDREMRVIRVGVTMETLPPAKTRIIQVQAVTGVVAVITPVVEIGEVVEAIGAAVVEAISVVVAAVITNFAGRVILP